MLALSLYARWMLVDWRAIPDRERGIQHVLVVHEGCQALI